MTCRDRPVSSHPSSLRPNAQLPLHGCGNPNSSPVDQVISLIPGACHFAVTHIRHARHTLKPRAGWHGGSVLRCEPEDQPSSDVLASLGTRQWDLTLAPSGRQPAGFLHDHPHSALSHHMAPQWGGLRGWKEPISPEGKLSLAGLTS